MNRKIVIAVSLVLAVIFTLLIVRSANMKYAELRKTVDVVKVTQFIPAGSEIRSDQVATVKMPEAVGKEFVTDPGQVVGKAAKISLAEGQYVIPGTVGDVARNPGMVEVHVPVDLSASAAVIAGDLVDIFAVGKSGQQEAAQAALLYRGARVLHSLDQSGGEISPTEKKNIGQVAGPPGAKVPVSVGLEVSRDAAPTISLAPRWAAPAEGT